ncbi:MAG: TraR/DksA C4-type zinc finger protein [candidate division Zixibacteria bacterium]|nr:TraR/DksA C4-type zinc finger protein [candidate division Zixibacteria bacterium]
MKKKELEKYEKLLLVKRAELLKELGLLKKAALDTTIKDSTGDLSSYSYHMADQGTDAMEREKAFLFASKSGRLLYHIDEALRRIKDKTYGKCQRCGKQISQARLEAVSHARFCIACKEKEEREKAEEI